MHVAQLQVNLHGARRGRTHRSTRDCHCCLGTPGAQSQRAGGSSRAKPLNSVQEKVEADDELNPPRPKKKQEDDEPVTPEARPLIPE